MPSQQTFCLYHTSGVKKKKICNLCKGIGIIARVTEVPFFENDVCCECPVGERKLKICLEPD
jgi:hypothetical protein